MIGREREIDQIEILLQREAVRLVTLTGTGGVGKTRLAIQVAREVAPNFADGVVYVPLGSVADAPQAVSAIAESLRIREAGEAASIADLVGYLSTRRMLLVLDNFEHVLGATSSVLQLLNDCPDITFLITSRTALRVTSEQEISLEPLRLPEAGEESGLECMAANPAVALFAERAENVTPRFSLNTDNVQVVAEICRRLDGIPLAIVFRHVDASHSSPQKA